MQSSKIEAEEEDDEKVQLTVGEDKLHQQFLNLQQQWLSFKRSNPSTTRTQRRLSPSKSNDHLVVKTLKLLGNDNSSPRSLMSFLQRRPLMTNDCSVDEIVRERREAIERGALKGRRRLFEAAPPLIGGPQLGFAEEGEEEEDYGVLLGHGNHWRIANNVSLVQESITITDDHEVRSVVSFDDSDSENDNSVGSRETPVCFQRYYCSLYDQKVDDQREAMMVEEREKVVARVEERRHFNGGDGNNGRRSYVVMMRWFAVASVIFAICIFRSFGQFDGESEVILVPT